MTALIRSELIAVRTLRSSWITAVSVIALAAIISAGSMSDAGNKGMITPAELREPLLAGAGILTAVVLAVFAALRASGEYRHRTISQRVLASPRRSRILAAGLVTYPAIGLVLGAAALGIGIAIATPIVEGKDLTLGLTATHVVAGVAGVVLFAAIGVSVGIICRSQPASMAVIGGAFVLEKIVGGLISAVAPYLPYELLNALFGIGGSPVSPGGAALLLAAIAVALAAVAYVLLDRRDIT
jgi:ABC-2 type transport system permease protein